MSFEAFLISFDRSFPICFSTSGCWESLVDGPGSKRRLASSSSLPCFCLSYKFKFSPSKVHYA